MIVGAMKCGTTSLHRLLSQHPEIVAGKRKELNYFRRRKAPNAEGYESLFPNLDKSSHAYTLDSSPNYTKTGRWPHVPGQIAALPGRKRLVYVLRNPIDRIDSHIAHNIVRERWTADDMPMSLLLDASTYAKQLGEYEKVGLLDDMLLVDFADFCAHPVGVSYRIHEFLGLRRLKPSPIKAQNVRKVKGPFLRPDQYAELRRILGPDVQTLITRYGFEPARSWAVT